VYKGSSVKLKKLRSKHFQISSEKLIQTSLYLALKFQEIYDNTSMFSSQPGRLIIHGFEISNTYFYERVNWSLQKILSVTKAVLICLKESAPFS